MTEEELEDLRQSVQVDGDWGGTPWGDAIQGLLDLLDDRGENFLALLQSKAERNGFHRELQAWVDNSSSVARALKAIDEPWPEEAP